MKELFDAIEQDPLLLKKDETIAKLTIFLHDLAYRNPSYRDAIAKINEITYQALYGMNMTESQRQYIEKTFRADQARIQQLHTITAITPTLQTYQKLLGEYTPFFVTSETNARFLISDDPAFAVRYGFPEICFPLSGKHALLFRKTDVASPIMGIDIPAGNRITIFIPNIVKYNLLQFCFASRWAFGDALNLGQIKLPWEKTQSQNLRRSRRLE